MKRLFGSRWSRSALSPRTRSCCIYYHQQQLPILRLQSTASAPVFQPDDPLPPRGMPTAPTPKLNLRKHPSPPPSLARSSAKLSALHARLSLPSRLPLETLARCLIDQTADPDAAFNNATLALLGNDLFGKYASETILCTYPRIPTIVLFAAMEGYIGPKALATIAREWGVEAVAEPGGEVDPGFLQCKRVEAGNSEVPGVGGLLRKEASESDAAWTKEKAWKRGVAGRTMDDSHFGEQDIVVKRNTDGETQHTQTKEEKEADKRTTVEQASAEFVKALMGAVYLHGGPRTAKPFFNAHILSRKLDVGSIFEFREPTRELSRLCLREGFASPVARILSETGRRTRTPVFVVGVYSGEEKMGEGSGSSLDEARIRAAVASLKAWYLYSPLEYRVPSDVEGVEESDWKPVIIDGGEVVA